MVSAFIPTYYTIQMNLRRIQRINFRLGRKKSMPNNQIVSQKIRTI